MLYLQVGLSLATVITALTGFYLMALLQHQLKARLSPRPAPVRVHDTHYNHQ